MIRPLETPARQAAALGHSEDRPWPVPHGPWLAAQTLEDVLLASWPAPAESLRPLLPAGLELETCAGSAWLSVVAFRTASSRLRGTLPLPLVSSFRQLNVRTYATAGGRPGIRLLSVDVSSPLAAEVARRLAGLPAHRARISCSRSGSRLSVESARAVRGGEPAVFSASWEPAGAPFTAAPGSTESFLAERFCLYAGAGERLRRVEVHHRPWPLRHAEGRVELNTVGPPAIDLAGAEPLLLCADRQDLLVWPPTRLEP